MPKEPLVEEIDPNLIENPFLAEHLEKNARLASFRREQYASDAMVRERKRLMNRNYQAKNRDYLARSRKKYFQKHKVDARPVRNASYARCKANNTVGYQNWLKRQAVVEDLKCRSGYKRITNYLYKRKLKPPVNFVMHVNEGIAVWTFAHP